MNILIVDDEIVQLESLRRGLRKRGMAVREALRARIALEWIAAPGCDIDLMVTDFAMPEMNGMELLKEIRGAGNRLPVIMMTAYGEKRLVLEALRHQCDGFLDKPFSLEQLTAEIDRVLAHRSLEPRTKRFTRMVPRFVHQINNPLASIMGSAELGLRELSDAKAIGDRMACILGATETIRQVCRDIIKLGQTYEEGTARTDVVDVAEASLGVFADLMTRKGVSLEREYPLRRWKVTCRAKSLQEILGNLILNAVEAMELSDIKRLKLAVEWREAAGVFCVVVEDSGAGIAPDHIPRVFSPYFTTKPGGNGLGLAIVRDLVEEMGGRVTVSSELGKGAVFRVAIPLEAGDGNRPDGASRSVPAGVCGPAQQAIMEEMGGGKGE
ncbi:MAG: response regulator [Syntrophobacteraceae bacterium]|nr:response regulator [Syntrophobacteraceae bacterium]